MRRKGRVIAADHVQARVCIDSQDACKDCAAGQFCHAARGRQTVVVQNSLNAQVGDDVCIEQNPSIGLVSAFLLFGLPVILSIIGLVVGTRWGDTGSLICGILGFAAGLIFAKIINNLLVRKSLFLPIITEIIERKDA